MNSEQEELEIWEMEDDDESSEPSPRGYVYQD